ncbi:hypothetical protein [Amycolatopsis anabasis]|uniref:hypothetical protein n=1 Tax=Amycolatopsis anabasis TaxID=1840409 RepID=UPI00131C4365|nr:hypothetical protein [Amycolatopsis anabasis]
MDLLNGGGLPTLLRCREQYPAGATHLGRLARPRHIGQLRETLDADFRVGIDNDAFSKWSLPAFVEQIQRIELALWGRVLRQVERLAPLAPLGLDAAAMGLTPPKPLPPWHKNLLFVTVPDVPFDAEATARRFADWALFMSHLPLALCVQDGAKAVGIPWGWPNLRALFMAGSTEYKLSDEMAEICREGKRRGLHIHCGRVNSRKRIRHLLALECVDSIDGTGFDEWRDTNLPWGLEEVSATSYQLMLGAG